MIDEHLFLAGRPPMLEYLAVMAAQNAGAAIPPADIAEQWRIANDLVQTLQQQEAGAADKHIATQLSPAQQAHADALVASAVFQRTHALVPAVIARIELDRLVITQKHINLAYVNALKTELADAPNEARITELCLPLAARVTDVHASRVAADAVVFSSRSADLRVLDQQLFSADVLQGFQPNGHCTDLFGVTVGTGINCLSAVHINGRMVLTNGSHRAYALRDLGVTHAPCVIHNIRKQDELALVGTPELLDQLDALVSEPRPAMLRDYFNPALVTRLPVLRKQRQIKLTYSLEVIDVPVTDAP